MEGHLESLLPKTSRVRRVVHHPAMPFEQVSGFVADLQEQDGEAAKALRLTIPTAQRTSEVIKGKMGRYFDKQLWTIPAERVKNHKVLRIPLTAAAVEILRPLCHGIDVDDWIFRCMVSAPISEFGPASELASGNCGTVPRVRTQLIQQVKMAAM